jgi:hypothetical protein
MTVLRNLTGRSTCETPAVSGGAFAVHDEPVPGFIRQMRMGCTGLLMMSRGTHVFVPIEELWKLAESAEPNFRPPAIPSTPRRTGKG